MTASMEFPQKAKGGITIWPWVWIPRVQVSMPQIPAHFRTTHIIRSLGVCQQMNICMHANIHTYIHIHMQWTYACMQTYIHRYAMNICVHAYIHTYVHIHMQWSFHQSPMRMKLCHWMKIDRNKDDLIKQNKPALERQISRLDVSLICGS